MNEENIIIKKEDGHASVMLKGSLTLPNIGAIKAEFDKLVKDAKSIIVETSEVEEVDLSFYQLIVALKSHCKTHSIDIITKIELPQDMSQLLTKTGLKF